MDSRLQMDLASANAMRQRGVLISACGRDGNVLKIRPPLVFGAEHVDLFVETLEQCLQADELASA